jgi:hypothetical protein
MPMPDHGSHESRAIAAIQAGDIEALAALLREQPDLATKRPDGSRTLLHTATDWPGHFPNSARTVALLIAAGADPSAFGTGNQRETPLHWAASSDDVATLDALLDGGADIEASGSADGLNTPLADAVIFGQWNAARRLIARGARATLWQAAALRLMPQLEASFADSVPSTYKIKNAFWCACYGGQQEPAEYLLSRGPDINWIGYSGWTALDAAREGHFDAVAAWLESIGARTAVECKVAEP